MFSVGRSRTSEVSFSDVLGSSAVFFFSSRRRHTRCSRDWSSDVCSSDLETDMSPARRRAGDISVSDLQPNEPGDEAVVDRGHGRATADRDRRDLRHELQSHAPHPRCARLLGCRRQHGRSLAGDRVVVETPPMALKLAADVLTLKTKHPFVIARGGDDDTRVVWVRLTDGDGVEGWGEADPSRYYGETADTVLAMLQRLESPLPADPFGPAA